MREATTAEGCASSGQVGFKSWSSRDSLLKRSELPFLFIIKLQLAMSNSVRDILVAEMPDTTKFDVVPDSPDVSRHLSTF